MIRLVGAFFGVRWPVLFITSTIPVFLAVRRSRGEEMQLPERLFRFEIQNAYVKLANFGVTLPGRVS